MWNLVLVRLEIVLVSVQDRYMVCAKHNIGSKIVLDAPDGTAQYKAQVEAHFGPIGDSASLDARYMHTLCRTYHRLRNHFGRT